MAKARLSRAEMASQLPRPLVEYLFKGHQRAQRAASSQWAASKIKALEAKSSGKVGSFRRRKKGAGKRKPRAQRAKAR